MPHFGKGNREYEMRRSEILRLALVLAMALAVVPALAAQDKEPVYTGKPKPAGATLLVLCDLACNWKLDGETMGHIDTGGGAKAKVELGQHVVDALTEDGQDKIEKDVEVKAAGQTAVHLALQPVRDARLKAAGPSSTENAADSLPALSSTSSKRGAEDFGQLLTSIMAFSPGGQEKIQAALWMRNAPSNLDLVTLNHLLDALPRCGIVVDAIVVRDRANPPFLSSLANDPRFSDNPSTFLDSKMFDAVLLFGFLTGESDSQTESANPYPMGSPNWWLSDMRNVSLTRALLLAAKAGKDLYVSPGTGDWLPITEANPIDAANRLQRIAWLGDGTSADLTNWCESIRTRHSGAGSERFKSAATAARQSVR
jgi:hypothetical protein